jgi:hypothetical protein
MSRCKRFESARGLYQFGCSLVGNAGKLRSARIYRVHSNAAGCPDNVLASLDAVLGKRLHRRSVGQKETHIHER